MIRLGLCSGACITRDIQGVIATALNAGLDAVEWSADVHVALHDLKTAESAMISTLSAGLTTASYASLYRAGSEDAELGRFDEWLGVASVLQSPVMRIYACAQAESGTLVKKAAALTESLLRLGDRAAKKGITICVSMGRGTCLDRYERGLELVASADHDFVRLAWEDLPLTRSEDATAALEDIGKMVGIAIARCVGRDGAQKTVAVDEAAWRSRLRAYKLAEGDPKMSSFVLLGASRAEGPDGDDALAADAAALRALVEELEPKRRA
jgi:hypothetical protein